MSRMSYADLQSELATTKLLLASARAEKMDLETSRSQLEKAFSATRMEIEHLRKVLDSSQKKWWQIRGKTPRSPVHVGVDMAAELGLPPARPLVDHDLDSLSMRHHGGLELDEEVLDESDDASAKALRIYRKTLFCTCSTVPPLSQPSLLAKIITFLPFTEIMRSQAVSCSWRQLFLRRDLLLWKAVVREALIPPKFRGTLWLMMCYVAVVDPLKTPASGCLTRIGAAKRSSSVRWRSLLAPFPPNKGPLHSPPPPVTPTSTVFDRRGMKVHLQDAAMESIFRRYHKCGLAAMSAANLEYARKQYLEDLSYVKQELEVLMAKQEEFLKRRLELEPKSMKQRILVSVQGGAHHSDLKSSLDGGDAEKFVKLANREKQCSTALQSIEPMFQSYIDVAYACQSDADYILSSVQPSRTFAKLNSLENGKCSASALPVVGGSIEAFCGVGAAGIMWANFELTIPKRVRSFDAFVAGQSPAALWASPHLVIEADVGRTYGVVSGASGADALASFHDAPLPKYASESNAEDAALPFNVSRAPVQASMTARERAFKKVQDRQSELADDNASPALTAAGATAKASLSSWDVDAAGGAGGTEPAVGLPARQETLAQEQAALREVLFAYSALDTDVGYCQGMNFIAAVLLRHFPQEYTLFALSVLMRRYCLSGIFSPGLERVGLCFYQFNHLLRLHLPKLHEHFTAQNVTPDMYASGWFMTLFTSMDVLPYHVTCVVWDAFMVDGWKTIFRVVLALLSIAEPVLLSEEFAVIVRYLNTFPRASIPAPRALLRLARSFKVTNRQLAALETRYKEQNPGMLEDDDGQEDFVELLHGDDPPEEPSPVELTPAAAADADDIELDDMDDLVTPSISLGDWVSGSASVGGASPAMSLSSFSSMPQESPEPRRFGALPQGKGIKKLFSKLRKGVP